MMRRKRLRLEAEARGETLPPLVNTMPARVPPSRQSESRVEAALRRVGGAGQRARSALIHTAPLGVGPNGSWVPGERAPSAMPLPKKRVPGGRIPEKMRKGDFVEGAASIERAERDGGAAPLDEMEILRRQRVRAVRMWTAHAAWCRCTAA